MDGDRQAALKALRLAAGLDRAGPGGRAHASAPFDAVESLGALREGLEPALPGFHDRAELVVAGAFGGAEFTASMGRLVGRHWTPLRQRGRTARLAELRYGRIDRWEGDRAAETWIILDVSAGLIDLGLWPAAPPMGPALFPAPLAFDAGGGEGGGAGDGAASLAAVEAMIAGLMRYDGRELASMRMRDHWRDDFLWYGPAAIGAFQGHDDYERGHQAPFLTAFPDRVGGNHVARVGEGAWVASGGWPSIRATHTGPGWLGLPATGGPVTMRVMDFWRVEPGGRLAENWVFIDLPDVLRQLGVDPFARLAEVMAA